jgi:hypothetical protein
MFIGVPRSISIGGDALGNRSATNAGHWIVTGGPQLSVISIFIRLSFFARVIDFTEGTRTAAASSALQRGI